MDRIELKPSGYGVAGVLSVLYWIIGPYPWLFLIINGLTKAVASINLFWIAKQVSADSRSAALAIPPLFSLSINTELGFTNIE